MALNEPFAPQSRKKVLEEMDNAFLYCFTVEAVVKILAMGFVIERNSYLRDPWNQLDFTVVCLDWLSFFLQGSYNFSILRSIRILRPLRTINRFPGMRVIVKSLLDSLPLLADAFILFLFIVLFFGIIGLQLYSGAFRQQCFCVTEGLQEADSNHPDLVKEFPSLAPYENTTTGALLPRPKGSNLTTECVEQEDGDFPGLFRPEGEERYCTESEGMGTGHCGDWEVCRPFGENPNDGVTNFDNLGWAVLLVFQVITLEGWASIMNLTRATKGIVNDLFYIGLVVFGAFFMINLVVAVLVSNFDQSSDEEAAGGGEQAGGEAKPGEPSPLGGSTGNAMGDTELQESLLADAVHAAEKTNPMYISRCFGCCRRHKKEGGPEGLREWRCSEGWADFLKCLFGEGGLFARISASAWFERFIMLVITVNTGTLAMDHWGMPVEMENFIELANFICTFIFIAEMVIKMAGLGIGNYWSNSWNKFDA
uniref:Ion transport domain-containing protein n=1 Tax=Chromera velia CCMP2878 TaxID=1169474 RepID=A0A0G4I592_9ALVE|eukprot:Cvel_36055.t1-p1 / transcript=Cvel_36055.t1 / gene=Cvel_36055 / organism=Chromera_velia_CCMP2878 / gene_product=Voltage-dependent calcium channel type A subunit, putative / transcript_product=Voltage-dependent calcium channel type A subunit, putative / location=Cvel_scaffold6899:238-2223(-) / protein_length=479 / sequence_SO=supercontig / SO=protein_coding / is_pseudo=false